MDKNKVNSGAEIDIETISRRRAPRVGANSEKAGAYQIATIISSNVVDPDGMLSFEQFITGYGEIQESKITGYVSSEIFDEKASTISHSLNKVNNEIMFGAVSHPINPAGIFGQISGFTGENWGGKSSLYFDMKESALPFISTEHRIGSKNNAPFSYDLKIRKNIKAGEYSLDFYFTYFNGEKWQCSKESVKFKVRNIFERHAVKFSTLGVVATVVGVSYTLAKIIFGI